MSTASRSEYAADVVAYRHGFRRYLRDLDDASRWRSARFSSADAVFEHDAERMLRLHNDGWIQFGWPEWAGGFGGTEEHRMAYFDELARARLPIPVQHQPLEQFLPPLIEYAPELAAVYLPRFLRGAEWWSTNASGRRAGNEVSQFAVSAAAGQRGELILTGPHTWSYAGPSATRVVLLAGADQPAHGTVAAALLVDADALGSAIRRPTAAGGRPDIVEITVDSIRIAGAQIIAEAEAALAVASHLSTAARGLQCYASLCRLFFDLGLLREAMAAAGSTQGQRQRFARAYVDVVSAQAHVAATIRAEAQSQQAVTLDDGIEDRLLSRARERVGDLILDVGRARMVRGTTDGSESLQSARAAWWSARTASSVREVCLKRERPTGDRCGSTEEALLQ